MSRIDGGIRSFGQDARFASEWGGFGGSNGGLKVHTPSVLGVLRGASGATGGRDDGRDVFRGERSDSGLAGGFALGGALG